LSPKTPQPIDFLDQLDTLLRSNATSSFQGYQLLTPSDYHFKLGVFMFRVPMSPEALVEMFSRTVARLIELEEIPTMTGEQPLVTQIEVDPD